MNDQTTPKAPKVQKQAGDKPTIGRMSLNDVDSALSDCEKTIKVHSDVVKTKLASNGTIPTNVLRELSRANSQRGRLMIRRIVLLIESGDAAVMELLDKIMKVKPSKSV